ncbi:hypothetical protein GH5_05941 [Leishmania sp. Ghana 2012 LV757]|uniref:hypothetical protein n=1 Tax=Leishmania sp. Ghana 2012 LV757 TaxID=2803181 RepID=UPI001B788A9C|nr:hypothetical protein GH5_05941 [Leishmania sp. Ghana 2012 LV757]
MFFSPLRAPFFAHSSASQLHSTSPTCGPFHLTVSLFPCPSPFTPFPLRASLSACLRVPVCDTTSSILRCVPAFLPHCPSVHHIALSRSHSLSSTSAYERANTHAGAQTNNRGSGRAMLRRSRVMCGGFSQEAFHRMTKYITSRNPNEKYLRTGHIVLETLKRYHAYILAVALISAFTVYDHRQHPERMPGAAHDGRSLVL